MQITCSFRTAIKFFAWFLLLFWLPFPFDPSLGEGPHSVLNFIFLKLLIFQTMFAMSIYARSWDIYNEINIQACLDLFVLREHVLFRVNSDKEKLHLTMAVSRVVNPAVLPRCLKRL